MLESGMRTVDYDDENFASRATALIDRGERFKISVSGWKARLLMTTVPGLDSARAMAITGAEVALILGLVLLATLAGVMLYAISKGRKVTGRGRPLGPGGPEIEIEVE